MRVVVIGTSGAGKSTFAQQLAHQVACPFIELDSLHWEPHWQSVSTEVFREAVRNATVGEHWIAAGNYSVVRDILWARATHIVWLNYGRWIVWPRVLSRTCKRVVSGDTLYNGNQENWRTAFFSRQSIIWWSVTTFAKNQKRYAMLRADSQYAHLQWHELRHTAQHTPVLQKLAVEMQQAMTLIPAVCPEQWRDAAPLSL